MALEIRVLVVEDDPETRMLTEALLSGRKGVCLCALAKDGLEGLELVEQTRPDIVLLDQLGLAGAVRVLICVSPVFSLTLSSSQNAAFVITSFFRHW